MNYRLAYAIGFHPWEDAAEEPAFVEKATELFAREERGSSPPHGRALDLGCGAGIWGTELAKRGWQVTGVDIVAKALRRAEKRVAKEGVEMRLIHGDVTRLEDVDVGHDFRLLVDTGTFHSLPRSQWDAMGRSVTKVAAPDATLLLLVWPRRRSRPLIQGADRHEVAEAFPDWQITHVEPSGFRLPKPLELIMNPDEHWYRLVRR